MAWWGKVIGGAFGFMLGGPLGALLGASLGHRFDAGLGSFSSATSHMGRGDQERVQAAFFTATFAILGYISKADGRVSQTEIALAEQLMRQMQLNPEQKTLARKLFNQGKRRDFAIDEVLAQFRRECHRRGNLIRMFVEIQIQAALADGRIAAEENRILRQVANALGINNHDLQQIINFMRGSTGGDSTRRAGKMTIAAAERILGVNKNTPLPEIRKSYRRLLGRHHPDKLVAKGLPEEMIKIANQKTHEIRTAWECLKAARQPT